MKKGHFIFESILLGITAVIGFIALVSSDWVLIFAAWLIPLGALQVIHSIFIAANYWTYKRVPDCLTIYWILSALDLLLLYFGLTVLELTVFAFALLLAVYLLGITYYFKQGAEQPADPVKDLLS